jgi:hypothetical protein
VFSCFGNVFDFVKIKDNHRHDNHDSVNPHFLYVMPSGESISPLPKKGIVILGLFFIAGNMRPI